MWHCHWELHVWWTSPFISDPPKLWNLPRGVLKQYWQLEQMKAVLQVMLKASIIVPLSGAMVHCRGLPPVGGMPLLLTGNILVGRGVAGCVKASTLALVVRMPLLLPQHTSWTLCGWSCKGVHAGMGGKYSCGSRFSICGLRRSCIYGVFRVQCCKIVWLKKKRKRSGVWVFLEKERLFLL